MDQQLQNIYYIQVPLEKLNETKKQLGFDLLEFERYKCEQKEKLSRLVDESQTLSA
jgi:hypothetical protein